MKPYEKILSKIEKELDSLRIEIEGLPNTNLINLPIMLVASILKLERFDKFRVLKERLDGLKSKADSALDTYSRSEREEDSAIYLSRITGVLQEISLLAEDLSKKDFHLLMSSDDSSSNMDSKVENKHETDWSDLDVKL